MALNPRISTWRGQRVWVIGASYGIGAALARRLINEGAQVAMSARSRDLLDASADGTDARVEVLDVTDPGTVAAAARRIVAAWGGRLQPRQRLGDRRIPTPRQLNFHIIIEAP